jgi:hypothetical protein
MTKEKDACPKPASKQFQGTGSTKLAVLDEKTSAGSQETPEATSMPLCSSCIHWHFKRRPGLGRCTNPLSQYAYAYTPDSFSCESYLEGEP